ncbi:MAG: hypothetical protein IJB26_04105 [Clostridia bacterium]|nr:hypothetical protein [Clostridia bacterium]
MIIDVTGTVLTPGNEGKDCLGNGLHFDKNGARIECCCDECDYAVCCYDPSLWDVPCEECDDIYCPRSQRGQYG